MNGVKDDNRPENLELWIRPQPSGIRATDAVAWARVIVDRYGGLRNSPQQRSLCRLSALGSGGESNPHTLAATYLLRTRDPRSAPDFLGDTDGLE